MYPGMAYPSGYRCKRRNETVPLKLDLKSGDKLVINGAVVENVGPNAKLLVHNESAILREKEILSVADTSTPAARVYFALQCAYMFPQKKEEYIDVFRGFLREYVVACPSAEGIADEIDHEVTHGILYKALKKTQKLINHEGEILQHLEHDLSDDVEEQVDA